MWKKMAFSAMGVGAAVVVGVGIHKIATKEQAKETPEPGKNGVPQTGSEADKARQNAKKIANLTSKLNQEIKDDSIGSFYLNEPNTCPEGCKKIKITNKSDTLYYCAKPNSKWKSEEKHGWTKTEISEIKNTSK